MEFFTVWTNVSNKRPQSYSLQERLRRQGAESFFFALTQMDGLFTCPLWMSTYAECLIASMACILGYSSFLRKDTAYGIWHHQLWWVWVIIQLTAVITVIIVSATMHFSTFAEAHSE